MDLAVIDAEPSALRDALYVLFRHKRRIVLAAFAAGMAAYLFGATEGAGYTATARVLAAPAGVGQDHGQAARNEAEILRDPALIRGIEPALKISLPPRGGAARLAQDIGRWWHGLLVRAALARPQTEDERLAAAFSHALHVAAVPDTDIVELRFSWSSPSFAALALNTLLRDQQRLAAGDAEATQGVLLAAAQLRDAQAQLDHLDQSIAALPLIAGSSPDAGAIEGEKDRVTSRIAATHASADALRVQRELLAGKLSDAEKAYAGGGLVDNPDALGAALGTSAIDETFVGLLEERGKLLARLPADSLKVHQIDQEIAQAREHAYTTVRQVLGDRLHGIDDRIAALAAQNPADEAALRGLDDRLVQLEALQGSRRSAAAQVEKASRDFDAEKHQAETAVHQAAGLRVLSEASAPADADFPSPFFLLCACSLAGFLLGLLTAIVAERTRITIDRPQDIARMLKIPVLASVPELQ